MSQLRKMQKKKIRPLVKELTKLADKYNRNLVLAKKEINKRWQEIKGFILRRLSINTLWVLRKTFKFSKKKFDEFNAGIMYMSDIHKNDSTVDAGGFQVCLMDECKYEFKNRTEISMDLAKWLEQDNAEELVTYQNIFDSLSTNAAIPINRLWETMMLWVLHGFMGFGKVRLGRFQDEMRKLWSISNDRATEMLAIVEKEVGITKVGTGVVYLEAE